MPTDPLDTAATLRSTKSALSRLYLGNGAEARAHETSGLAFRGSASGLSFSQAAAVLTDTEPTP